MGSPDTLVLYSHKKLYQIASAYGVNGRLMYIETRIKYDVAWPIIYTLFFITSISWFGRNILSPDSKAGYANILPVFAALFDFSENISVSLVMYLFPEKEIVLSNIASYSTFLKWLFVSSSMAVLFIFVFLFTWKQIKNLAKKTGKV